MRGLQGKRSCIEDTLSEVKPDLFLIPETQLKNNVGVHFDGYNFFGRSRTDKSGGGVGILIKDEFSHCIAPHTSQREIEILWLSVRRKNKIPIYFGIYYGKQESRTNKEEIEYEMDLLNEEIMEIKNEGEVILMMDGNGKVGLLGEEPSRNGKLLKSVFEATNLCLLNGTDKCVGKVTRQNDVKNEKSAIDFVLTSTSLENAVESVLIDEEGLHRITGANASDHNTIILSMNMNEIQKVKTQKKTKWRLNTPEGNWELFQDKISNQIHSLNEIIKNRQDTMSQRFHIWKSRIERIAIDTIGKTTVKAKGNERFSMETRTLQKER